MANKGVGILELDQVLNRQKDPWSFSLTGNTVIPKNQVKTDLDRLLDTIGPDLTLGDMNNYEAGRNGQLDYITQQFKQMQDTSMAGVSNDNHMNIPDKVLPQLLKEYGLPENWSGDDFTKWLQFRNDKNTEKDDARKDRESRIKGALAGAEIGSKLADKLPYSKEEVAAPARGFGVVHRK